VKTADPRRAEGELEAFRLDGRVALVTGAASGIGRATARVLSAAGARVALGDVAEDGLAETLALLPAEGAVAAATDVTRRADLEALVQRAVSAFGRLDVVANVAGVLRAAPLAELDEGDLDGILAVNLKGVLFGCQAALPELLRHGGSIVNVASSAAFDPHPTLGAYTVSKAGVVALTRVLAAEVARRGVRVNAVAPGMVDTPMAGFRLRRPDGSLAPGDRERVLAAARERSPLGTEGRPEDVALAILYLASDAARYVTGQVLHQNGGHPMV
jgi:3-oxoacyl-[acyl-carrier protein] reductase